MKNHLRFINKFWALQIIFVVTLACAPLIPLAAEATTVQDTGSITLCKLIKDSEGGIATNSDNLPAGSFSLSLLKGATTSPMLTMLLVNAETFSPNAKILSEENDAYCETFSDLPLGDYYYSEEVVSGSDWLTPKYNDQVSTAFDSIEDVFSYSPELWNNDPLDDENRNQNADGHIVLTEARPNRTLVVVNTYEKQDEPEPQDPVTIIATKITCEDEADLPNWGEGGPDINANTAADFLASHQSCSLEEGRNFQWGYESVSDPGKDFIGEAPNTGEAINEWKTFGPSNSSGIAEVSIEDLKDTSRIWVREILTEDDTLYFTEPPVVDAEEKDDVSAEMYCHNDTLNYDNYDFIVSPEYGQTYHCVAFNVATPEPPVIPYCGDGIINQKWEQCDGSENCTAQCQIEDSCSETIFAKIEMDEVENWDGGNLAPYIYLGSATNKIPAGVWFPIYHEGTYIIDPDLSSYENVEGLAVERQEGSLRVLLHGSHDTSGKKEHVHGSVEFWGGDVNVLDITSDNSGNNKLEGGKNGTKGKNPGNDEIWLESGDITHSYYWLTVDVADDGFYTEYDFNPESLICENQNTPPHINLLGDNPLEIILGSEYLEPGYTADDNEDGDLTGSVVVDESAIDPNVLGTYFVTYDVEDSGGLTDHAQREVRVVEINICELIDGQTGWLGLYYDYPMSHPDMQLDSEDWGNTYGDPLGFNEVWSTNWYNSSFFKFAQVDSSLMFGSDFFPMDGIEPAEGKIYDHNFFFGAHWRAKVSVPAEGDYWFSLASDDDSWVYLDGELVESLPGIHAANSPTQVSVHLIDTHIVDIFFAERHTVQSNMSFEIQGEGVIIEPYAEECEDQNTPPVITLIGDNPLEIIIGTTFTDPGATANDLEDGDLTSEIVVGGDTVDPNTLGTYTITYYVEDSEGLSDSTERDVIVKEQGGGEDYVDLTTTKTASVGTVETDTPFDYVITVKNNGNLTASGIEVTDILDSNLIFVSATTTKGDYATSTSTWTIGDLIAGEEVSLTITVKATAEGEVANTAVADSNEDDNNDGDNTSTVNITIDNPDVPPPTPPSGGGGGSFSGGRRHTVGEILGATTCSYLRDFLKIDWQNDPTEVLKLQNFLNIFEGESLALTGVFNEETYAAVERFQNKYFDEILAPWGHDAPTGFVYITTKNKINEIYCNTIIPFTLSEQSEIDAFKNFLISGGIIGGVSSSQIGYAGSVAPTVTVVDEPSLISISGVVDGDSYEGSDSPVIELESEDGMTEKATGSLVASITRNAAVSLFALPEAIWNNGRYFLLALIILAIIITIARWFINSGEEIDEEILTVADEEEVSAEEESPIIAMPPASTKKEEKKESVVDVLPPELDEEIIIEGEEDEEDLENN